MILNLVIRLLRAYQAFCAPMTVITVVRPRTDFYGTTEVSSKVGTDDKPN